MNEAANDATNLVTFYPFFINTIYLGAHSDSTPKSFTGYLKEFKFLTAYHSIAQMQDEKLRLMRWYSYDDDHLVAYWKLNEAYSATDIEYEIHDYSKNMNKLVYSTISEPDYPTFIQDTSIKLNLCVFHDVADCMTLDYTDTHEWVPSGRRYSEEPTLTLRDGSHTIAADDELWFMTNNTVCDITKAKARMVYSGTAWEVPDKDYAPHDLAEGEHYQICYKMNNYQITFQMF